MRASIVRASRQSTPHESSQVVGGCARLDDGSSRDDQLDFSGSDSNVVGSWSYDYVRCSDLTDKPPHIKGPPRARCMMGRFGRERGVIDGGVACVLRHKSIVGPRRLVVIMFATKHRLYAADLRG
jgi:hypothetical protein